MIVDFIQMGRNTSEEAKVAGSGSRGKRWLFFAVQIVTSRIQFLQVSAPYEPDFQSL